MTSNELARILKETHERAPTGEKVVRIHLFGIRYAKELAGHDTKLIAGLAGIGESFGTEIRKGMKLAQYVSIR